MLQLWDCGAIGLNFQRKSSHNKESTRYVLSHKIGHKIADGSLSTVLK